VACNTMLRYVNYSQVYSRVVLLLCQLDSIVMLRGKNSLFKRLKEFPTFTQTGYFEMVFGERFELFSFTEYRFFFLVFCFLYLKIFK
jgi:hypothetical protein